MKKIFLKLSLIATLLSITCVTSAFADTDKVNADKERNTTRVTSKTLGEIAIYPEFSVPATAISMNDSRLSAEVRATVIVFPVLVGDIVERGEVLVQLDERSYKLNLLRAKTALKGIDSRLTLAKYRLKQAMSLSKEKAISNEKLQERKANVRSIKAERNTQKVVIAVAKKELDKCIITAPFDAIIIERIAQVGELASPGSALIRVIDASRIEVAAKFQAQDVKSLQQSKHFQFISQGINYDVTLRKITPAFDPVQRNREARFLFTKKRALPGSTGTLRWTQSQARIPANMLIQRDNKLGIFIIDDNIARFVPIENAHEGRPAVTDLPSSTKLIINGRFAIQNGTQVSID